MTRGIKYGSDIDNAISELYGGFKLQIIFFAAETGTSANWVAQRISALLSPQGAGVQHHMPNLREASTGDGRAVESVALALDAHSGRTPSTIETQRQTSNNAAGEVKSKRGPQKFYASLSETAKRELNLRRLKKRKDEAGIRMYKGLLAKMKGKATPKHKRPSDDPELRKIYSDRYAAKKAGLPLPPLPGKESAKSAKPAKSAKVVVGRNGHRYPLRTPEEKAARHALHVARWEAKKNGLPLPPLPGQEAPSPAN